MSSQLVTILFKLLLLFTFCKPVFYWVLKSQNSTFRLCFVTTVWVFLTHSTSKLNREEALDYPTMTPECLGLPTIAGKTALGASSPAKPLFIIVELSMTRTSINKLYLWRKCTLDVSGTYWLNNIEGDISRCNRSISNLNIDCVIVNTLYLLLLLYFKL